MQTTIKVTDDILLEILNENHAKAIYEIANDSRSLLREWLPWVDRMQSVDFINNFIANSKIRNANGEEYPYVILYKSQVVGRIGVYQIDHQNEIGEIGYWLAENYTGKGITTQACVGLIDYCFDVLKLNRIEIKCGTENYKSQGIPERLKFKMEGIIRQGELNQDKFIDLNLYSILKDEWGNRKTML